MKIHIAEGLYLPVDIATQTLLVVGKRNSGKSNTCVRLAEQLFAAKIPFVAIDPVDNWWGLKSSKDGSEPGLPVTIFGGKHADVPLEATGGQLIADVVVESRASAVLSIRHFSNRERARFVAEFFDRLYRKNSEALHVFLEEAHEVAPQSPFKGDEEMLGRVTRLWKLGRTSGLGGSAITQRPASLSKNITTQAEILIVHRMIGPQDVAAIKEWIKYHGESDAILAELSGLKTGEAYLWAPDFPEGDPIGLRRVKILKRETFDSGATPKAGHVQREPKVLAMPDLEKLRVQMAESIERAKAEDPKALRQRIAHLEREIRELRMNPAHTVTETVKEVIVHVPVLDPTDIARISNVAKDLKDVRDRLDEVSAKVYGALVEAIHKIDRNQNSTASRPLARTRRKVELAGPAGARPIKAPAISHSGNGRDSKLDGGERKVLTALAQRAPEPCSKRKVAILAGYAMKGGRFNNILGALRSRELIVGGDPIEITRDGLYALGDFTPLPVGEDLLEHWKRELGTKEGSVLAAIAAVYPSTIGKDDVAQATDYEVGGGRFNNILGKLRTLGLIDRQGGELRASEEFFS